ncbi:hypothetical protein FOCC_FOCC008344 [Frankliniella occidentalis]|nr:hypothetical protein FOCC_FOCC008344 [Frankliniella occidentalis]
MEFSSPYCPQQNGKAERMNITIAERMRGLLFDSRLNPDIVEASHRTSHHPATQTPHSLALTLEQSRRAYSPQHLGSAPRRPEPSPPARLRSPETVRPRPALGTAAPASVNVQCHWILCCDTIDLCQCKHV